MKTYVKRLQDQADCVGIVQETLKLDTRQTEAGAARMVLDQVAAAHPEALMIEVSVEIIVRMVVEAKK